jgi:hypothetical protein
MLLLSKPACDPPQAFLASLALAEPPPAPEQHAGVATAASRAAPARLSVLMVCARHDPLGPRLLRSAAALLSPSWAVVG